MSKPPVYDPAQALEFVVTLFRDGYEPQRFNANTLPSARQAMLKACASKGAVKVEMAVTIDRWRKGDAVR